MDENKIEKAKDEVMALVNDLSSPKKMTKEEASALYSALADDLNVLAESLG